MADEYGYLSTKKRMAEHPKRPQSYGPKQYTSRVTTEKTFYGLPHHCDEWYIGDTEDVRALITDLEELIKQ